VSWMSWLLLIRLYRAIWQKDYYRIYFILTFKTKSKTKRSNNRVFNSWKNSSTNSAEFLLTKDRKASYQKKLLHHKRKMINSQSKYQPRRKAIQKIRIKWKRKHYPSKIKINIEKMIPYMKIYLLSIKNIKPQDLNISITTIKPQDLNIRLNFIVQRNKNNSKIANRRTKICKIIHMKSISNLH
jgi:hypothetical protein